jgi:hypothetical protein
VFGGVDLVVAGVKVTSNEPARPIVAASIFLLTYLLLGDPLRDARRLRMVAGPALAALRSRSRKWVPRPTTLAWMLSAAVVAVTWTFGSKAVCCADSYGYLSQSDLWTEGGLKVRQPLAAEVPWPDAGWSFTPVGSYQPMHSYRRVEGADRWSIVPFYPQGLSLLLAAAGAVGGFQAKFIVVPLLAGLAVIATYGIGVRMVSPAAGLIAAWLFATSPTLLFMSVPVMSDVPVAGLVAAAFYLLLGGGIPRAAGAGVLISLAVLVRPVLAPLVGVMALWYVIQAIGRETRAAAIREAVTFAAAGLPAAIFFAVANTYLYGSALRTGYGGLETRFSVDFIVPNIRNYVQWFAETQTPAALLGMLAVFVPSRMLWPQPIARKFLVVAAMTVMFVWSVYFYYEVWDAWWYLRFLLPSYPFILVGVGAIGAVAIRSRRGAVRALLVLVVLAWGAFQGWTAYDRLAFQIWAGDRRAVAGAHMVRSVTDRDSVIFAGLHTGSLRYYGGRMTAYYLFFEKNSGLDRAVAWLDRQGIHSYLLLEDWELDHFKEHIAGQKVLAVLSRPPLAVHRDPGTLYLFDLVPDSAAAPAQPVVWTGVDRSVWAVPPAQTPRLLTEGLAATKR